MQLAHHDDCLRRNNGYHEARKKDRRVDRENRFPFSGARLPPAQRSLISSSPNSTVVAFFFSRTLPLSIRSTPASIETSTMFYFAAEISIVTEVFYVLSSVLPSSARHVPLPHPVSQIPARKRFSFF